MRWRVLLLTVLFCATLSAPASAQSIFGKKKPANKPSPADRVAQLILTLKTDQDESKRESAATELRQFDPKTHPEVIPVLIETLQNDPRPAVRMEACESLGRMPVSQQAGWAMEQAAAKDSSTRVRLQARSSLVYYRLRGYRSDAKPADEPPPPDPTPTKSGTPSPVPPVPKTKPGVTPTETAPPPLAVPPSSPIKPLPVGPQTEPPPKTPDRGPDLTPP